MELVSVAGAAAVSWARLPDGISNPNNEPSRRARMRRGETRRCRRTMREVIALLRTPGCHQLSPRRRNRSNASPARQLWVLLSDSAGITYCAVCLCRDGVVGVSSLAGRRSLGPQRPAQTSLATARRGWHFAHCVRDALCPPPALRRRVACARCRGTGDVSRSCACTTILHYLPPLPRTGHASQSRMD